MYKLLVVAVIALLLGVCHAEEEQGKLSPEAFEALLKEAKKYKPHASGAAHFVGPWDIARQSSLIFAATGDAKAFSTVLRSANSLQRLPELRISNEILYDHLVFPGLITAAYYGHMEVLLRAIQVGVDVIGHGDLLLPLLHSHAMNQKVSEVALHLRMDSVHGTLLHAAVLGGQIEITNRLKKMGFPTTSEGYPFSILHLAVLSGKKEMVEFALQEGVDIDEFSFIYEKNVTAVQFAAHMEYIDILELLVTNGADLTIGEAGDSPLMSAVSQARTEVVRYLIDNGADVNQASAGGVTPLQLAASLGRYNLVEILLEAGAQPDQENEKGETALFLASKHPYVQIVQLLVSRGADASHQVKNGRSILHAAAKTGSIPTVSALLEGNVNMSAVNPMGMTAFHIAAENNHTALVEYFVEKGVDVDHPIQFPDGKTRTIFDLCVKRCAGYMVSKLLDLGANINAVEERLGIHNAMTMAVLYKRISVIDTLRSHGMDVNALPKEGRSPLFWAVKDGSRSFTRFLLQYGADPNIANDNGNTPLSVAVARGDTGAIKVLLEGGADPNTVNVAGQSPLFRAVKIGNFGITATLLRAGANPDTSDNEGNWAIHEAVSSGQAEILELLIRAGADLEVHNTLQQTPLAAAIMEKKDQIVFKILLAQEMQKREENVEACWVEGWDVRDNYLRKSNLGMDVET